MSRLLDWIIPTRAIRHLIPFLTAGTARAGDFEEVMDFDRVGSCIGSGLWRVSGE